MNALEKLTQWLDSHVEAIVTIRPNGGYWCVHLTKWTKFIVTSRLSLEDAIEDALIAWESYYGM